MDAAEGDPVLFTHMVNRDGSNNFSPSRAKGIEQKAKEKVAERRMDEGVEGSTEYLWAASHCQT